MFGTEQPLSYQINSAHLYITVTASGQNISLAHLLLPKYSLQGKHLNRFISTGIERRAGKNAKGMSLRRSNQMFRGCFMRRQRSFSVCARVASPPVTTSGSEEITNLLRGNPEEAVRSTRGSEARFEKRMVQSVRLAHAYAGHSGGADAAIYVVSGTWALLFARWLQPQRNPSGRRAIEIWRRR